MQLAKLLITMLAVTMVAGCASDESTEPEAGNPTTPEDTPAETGSQNTTPPGASPAPTVGNESAENVAPTLTFSSDLSAGAPPLVVSFAINGTDADGDNLTWTLDVGVEGVDVFTGTEMPALVEFTFETSGIFVAVANVTDGMASRTANITITVTEAAAPVPGPLIYSGSSVGSGVLGCFVYDGDIYYYYDGTIAGFWLFKVDGEPLVGAVTTEWWDGDSGAGDLGASGTIPSPSDNVAVCSDMPGDPLDFTMTLYHPDYPI